MEVMSVSVCVWCVSVHEVQSGYCMLAYSCPYHVIELCVFLDLQDFSCSS